jgi:DNA repair protein RadC
MKNLLPEFKLSYKKKGSFTEMYPIKDPESAAEMCRRCFNPDTIDWKEEAIVIALNRANLVLGWYHISSGGINGTVVDPRVVFQVALTSNSTRLILTHNHPSGNLSPSQGDKDLTKEIVKGGKFLQIELVDHIIITSEGYTSFCEEGWL